ncbi:MAG: hypothetical protein IKC09_08480 [Oscillospiraceae bacterium]|nr:hypothetical protein [Oscillospiraceae bacterium]
MKRIWALVLTVLFLSGCGGEADSMDRALALRQRIQESGCAFTATVHADYAEAVQSFVLRCQADQAGEVAFEVLSPEEISGITGSVHGEKGKLTFDDRVLVFDTLADGQLAPVTAPWVLVHTLRSGYIVSCGSEGSGLILSIDDSYREDSLRLEIRVEQDVPVSAEILWQGRRILSMRIENFHFV